MLRIFNTLTKSVQRLRTRQRGSVGMYTCGPTVYRYAHIGNLRTYLMADWVRRVLQARGHEVHHVKNITDVGHMRQELLESGGDKMVLAALAEGKTPRDIARFYAEQFHKDEARLNILPATVYPWATDHIPSMISLVEDLLSKGYAYQAGPNIYFDVSKFRDYGKLSGNTAPGLLEGVRVEADPLKGDPRDFTLWKGAEADREMKWDSPWGPGFPGWHIECSAMASQYLGARFDIHTGGVDNIFPHHEDEIAQSEAALGHQHVSYWVHGQHLLADGVKMAKSLGNVFVLEDLVERGFDPLAFRYLCMTVRYRHRLDFTFTSLKASERALDGLRHRFWVWKNLPDVSAPVPQTEEWRRKFWDTLENDLDLPGALALTWELAKSDLPGQEKRGLLLEFDQVFGLGLDKVPRTFQVPEPVLSLVDERHRWRQTADYIPADSLRHTISSRGYVLEDSPEVSRIRTKTAWERRQEKWPSVSSPGEVASYVDQPSSYDFSFVLNVHNYAEDAGRCIYSILKNKNGYSVEIVVVDNGSTNGTADMLEDLRSHGSEIRVLHCDHALGDAAGKNIGLRLSLGRNVVILDTSVEVVGDILSPIKQQLSDATVGIFGPYGLTTQDMRHFHEDVSRGDVDAVQGYCMAFRREALKSVGLLREGFRFYRNLDIDHSFQFKDKGYRIVADNTLPVVRHEHRQWAELDENQREELSRRNYRRFFKRWGRRPELLVASRTGLAGSPTPH